MAIHASFMATLPAASSKQEQLLLEGTGKEDILCYPWGPPSCSAVVLRYSEPFMQLLVETASRTLFPD